MTSAFFACNSVIVVMLTLYALCKLVLTAQETTDSARIDEARSFGGVHIFEEKWTLKLIFFYFITVFIE